MLHSRKNQQQPHLCLREPCFSVCTLPSPGFTSLRHSPPLEESYPEPTVGCEKAGNEGGAGVPVHTIKHKTACCSCAGGWGQRAQGARFVGATSGRRGRRNPARAQRGPVTSSRDCPPSVPNPTRSRAVRGQSAEGEVGEKIHPP